MKVCRIVDIHNPNKIWLIKRYDCYHYYVNQIIFNRLVYSRYLRVSKQFLVSVLGNFDIY